MQRPFFLASLVVGRCLVLTISFLLSIVSAMGSLADADAVVASGNTVFHFQNYTLTADKVTYSQITGTAEGTGHAKLICPNGRAVFAYQITVPRCEVAPLGPFRVVGGSRAEQHELLN
jgi:lipopolysaccharide export system protein LptA